MFVLRCVHIYPLWRSVHTHPDMGCRRDTRGPWRGCAEKVRGKAGVGSIAHTRALELSYVCIEHSSKYKSHREVNFFVTPRHCTAHACTPRIWNNYDVTVVLLVFHRCYIFRARWFRQTCVCVWPSHFQESAKVFISCWYVCHIVPM